MRGGVVIAGALALIRAAAGAAVPAFTVHRLPVSPPAPGMPSYVPVLLGLSAVAQLVAIVVSVAREARVTRPPPPEPLGDTTNWSA